MLQGLGASLRDRTDAVELGTDYRCNIRDCSEQHEWVILRRQESASPPKARGLYVNGIDDECAPADQATTRRCSACLERAGANSFSDPILICRKLSE
jgi:hypothetical protein